MFTLDNFMSQLTKVEQLGPMSQVMKMFSGKSKAAETTNIDDDAADREFVQIRAIYNSMTKKERQSPEKVDDNRRRRVAGGAGVELVAVCRFLLQFDQTREMMKRIDRRLPRRFFH